MRPLFFIILTLLSVSALAQQRQQQLIVVEYKYRDGGYSYLTSYHFEDGVFTSKDTIFEGSRFKNRTGPPHVQFSGGGYLHQNRYVVTSNGAVIDIKRKELIWENSDLKNKFTGTLGDTLVYKNDQPATFNFLDLVSLRYQKAEATLLIQKFVMKHLPF